MHPSDYRYLVIEDDRVANDFLVYMLRTLGATSVESAANGEVALAYLTLTEKKPDIIICDLRMPQIDGIAFLRHLAEKKFNGGVVLASESSNRILRMASYLAEAHNLNVLGVMSKPFHLVKSTASLENFLKRFKGRDKSLAYLPSSGVTPSALREAIRHNQIVPFFQPKIDIKTNKTVGVEALARWVQPDKSILPPGLFIPVAEKHGMINELTESMLAQTLSQASLWHAGGLKFSVAINFSALSLSDVNLPDRLDIELKKAKVDPSYLTLEVTESCLLENITASLETLLRLRLKGIALSIDDFGTGHSSFEQLHRIPFSELKIDRVFVNGAAHDDEAHVLLQSAVALAKHMNLVTVAEGVETHEDWEICAALGCHIAQGFLIGRPMPNDAFLEWYNQRKNAA